MAPNTHEDPQEGRIWDEVITGRPVVTDVGVRFAAAAAAAAAVVVVVVVV